MGHGLRVSSATRRATLNRSEGPVEREHHVPFDKMQGVGNDFVVIDAYRWPDTDWSQLAPTLCNRHFGIGSDGLLLLESSERADYRMRMFNPDGTEDDCGNGLRCIVHFICRHYGARQAMTVETLSGIHAADVLSYSNMSSTIRIGMGNPLFSSRDIPMAIDADTVVDYPIDVAGVTRRFTCLNSGSTHAVTFVESPVDDATFQETSPALESHPLFPDRTSVIWAWPAEPDEIGIRIWERGAGETLGCGTGACAAAVAWRLRTAGVGTPDMAGSKVREGAVTVRSRGGALNIEWPTASGILMTGPAATVFEGSWALLTG